MLKHLQLEQFSERSVAFSNRIGRVPIFLAMIIIIIINNNNSKKYITKKKLKKLITFFAYFKYLRSYFCIILSANTVKNVKTRSKSGQNSHGMKLLTNKYKSHRVYGIHGIPCFPAKLHSPFPVKKDLVRLLLFLQRCFTQNQG